MFTLKTLGKRKKELLLFLQTIFIPLLFASSFEILKSELTGNALLNLSFKKLFLIENSCLINK
jgi:hypothetical protein